MKLTFYTFTFVVNAFCCDTGVAEATSTKDSALLIGRWTTLYFALASAAVVVLLQFYTKRQSLDSEEGAIQIKLRLGKFSSENFHHF